jgi:hypothetical protein
VADGGGRLVDRTVAAGPWPWVSVGLAALWLVTLGLWLRERGRRAAGRDRRDGAPPAPSLHAARSLVRAACEAGDPRAAREALLAWAAARWPRDAPPRLRLLAERLGGDSRPVLEAMDLAIYGRRDDAWDGESAWRVLAPLLERARGEATGEAPPPPLPPLYPGAAGG